MSVIRISKGQFDPKHAAEAERLLRESERALRQPLSQLAGLVHYYVGIDRERGFVTNVSVWDSLEHAHQMDTLQAMLAQRPVLEDVAIRRHPAGAPEAVREPAQRERHQLVADRLADHRDLARLGDIACTRRSCRRSRRRTRPAPEPEPGREPQATDAAIAATPGRRRDSRRRARELDRDRAAELAKQRVARSSASREWEPDRIVQALQRATSSTASASNAGASSITASRTPLSQPPQWGACGSTSCAVRREPNRTGIGRSARACSGR